MTYKRYEKYKDSGIEWIGEIPENWVCSNFRRYTYLQQGLQIAQDKRFHKYEDGRLVYLTVKFLNSKNKESEIEYIEGASDNVICNKDDILLGRTGATGKVVTDVEGVFHNNFFKINYDKKSLIKEFLVYYLTQNNIQEHFKLVSGTTTIPDLNHGEFLSTKLVVPVIREQKQIIKFLDKKTTEIDSLIQDKEMLIELLKEQRQAIITEAVTKGLDNNVSMKDSGVNCIGEIPRNWEIVKIKNVAIVNPNKSELKLDKDEKVSFIPMENISLAEINTTISKTLDIVYSGYTYFRENDIILAKVTPCFENGNMAIAKGLKNGTGFGTTEIHVLRATDKINNVFLFYVIQENRFKLEGVSTMYGVGGLKRIPTSFISNFKFAIPSIKEQKEIVDFLDDKTSEIDCLINDVKVGINNLKKYKQSLISEVVTGKINILGQ